MFNSYSVQYVVKSKKRQESMKHNYFFKYYYKLALLCSPFKGILNYETDNGEVLNSWKKLNSLSK